MATFNVPCFAREKYFITIIDDFSRYGNLNQWMPLRYINEVERQLNRKTIRSMEVANIMKIIWIRTMSMSICNVSPISWYSIIQYAKHASPKWCSRKAYWTLLDVRSTKSNTWQAKPLCMHALETATYVLNWFLGRQIPVMD